MVSALDEAVGNITDALRKRGYMNNSLIVFTSDVSRTQIFTCKYLITGI